MVGFPKRAAAAGLVVWLLVVGRGGRALGSGTIVTAGPEFQVNTYTTSRQDGPSVAHMGAGGFVIAWSGNQPMSAAFVDGVLIRVYDSTGGPVAEAEALVDVRDRHHNVEPVLATGSDGTFVVVWREYDRDDFPDDRLFLRKMDSRQRSVSEELQLADGDGGDFFASIESLDNDAFLVAWAREAPDVSSSATSVVARGVRPNAEPRDDLGVLSSDPAALGTHPDLGRLSGNRVAAVWMELGADGHRDGIVLRVVDSRGKPINEPSVVNAYTTGVQQFPSIATFPDGSFVVSWDGQGQSSAARDIFGRRFDEDGRPVGADFRVNTYTTGDQSRSRVVAVDKNRFAVFWFSDGQDGSGRGVFGREFSWATQDAGSEFQVNSYTTGDQGFDGLDASSDGLGQVVVVWSGRGDQDGDKSGIFARMYCEADFDQRRCGLPTRRLPRESARQRPPIAGDALEVVRAALGLTSCPFCECDVDGNGRVTVSDALLLLHVAVGLPRDLECPACCRDS